LNSVSSPKKLGQLACRCYLRRKLAYRRCLRCCIRCRRFGRFPARRSPLILVLKLDAAFFPASAVQLNHFRVQIAIGETAAHFAQPFMFVCPTGGDVDVACFVHTHVFRGDVWWVFGGGLAGVRKQLQIQTLKVLENSVVKWAGAGCFRKSSSDEFLV
jgi:hypothetical protein